MFLGRARWLGAAIGLLVGLPGPASADGGPTATLIQVIDTSTWSRPSPDPTGLAYLPATGKLYVSDSEVDETPVFRGANVFQMRRSGSLRRAFSVGAFSDEPAGVAVRPRNRRTLFLADDDSKRVYILKAGPDRRLGTRDDRVRSFSTKAFGSRDPEGLAFGRRSLFVSDGRGTEVYRVRRRGNFDGAPPKGNDVISHFDTAALGMRDPEGIEYDPVTGHLFIVSRRDKAIAEVMLQGVLVNLIDISWSGILKPSGIAMVRRPEYGDAARVYVADRGVDNAQDPDENDGRIFVFSITW